MTTPPSLAPALALVAGLAACTAEPPRPAPPGRPVVATFSGSVDLATGRLTIRSEPAGAAGAALAVEIPIDQDGTPGTGRPDTVELVTERVGTVAGGCGALDGFEGDVRVRSFHAGAALRNVHVELTSISAVGREACNSALPGPGLSDAIGLFGYGDLGRAGAVSDSAVRTWRFRVPDQTAFTFRGHVLADVVTADAVAPVTTATPAGGLVGPGRTVALACSDAGSGCAATYYTLDGSPPTAASARYLAPIPIDASLTVRFFSVDGLGNAEVPGSAAFTLDAAPPTILSSDPAAGAAGVQEGALLAVTFSEPMDTAATAAALTLTGPAGAVAGSVGWDAAAQVFTLTPAAPLARGASYLLAVGTGARDLAGNALAAAGAVAFSTRPLEDLISGPGSATLEPGGLAFDGAGYGLAVWRATRDEVRYACFDPGLAAWLPSQVLDANGGGSEAPRVAAGPSGFAVAWFGTQPKATVFTGCSPAPATSLATDFYGFDLAVGANDTTFLVVWSGTSGGSWESEWTGTAWSARRSFTSAINLSKLAVAGEPGGWRVVYLSGTTGFAVRKAAGLWDTPLSLGLAGPLDGPVVASAGGLTCLAWGSFPLNGRIETGGTGTTTSILAAGGASGTRGLAVAVNGGQCLVVSNTITGRAARFDGAAWQPAVALGFTGTVDEVDVAPFGASDFAVAALQTGDLRLVRSSAGAWGTPVLAEGSAEPATRPYIAASPAGPRVLFAQADAAAHQAWTSSWDGTAAPVVTLRSDTHSDGPAANVRLAANAAGDVLAVWTQLHRAHTSVYWSLRTGGAWSTPQVLAVDGSTPVVGSNGADFLVLHTVGTTTATDLVARRFSGGTFGAATTLASAAFSAAFGSLQVASDGAGFAAGWTVYTGLSTRDQPQVRILDGTSWLSAKSLAAAGSRSTNLTLAGRTGEYLAAWIDETSTTTSARAWRASQAGATWTWDAAATTLAANTGFIPVALAAGPGGFVAAYLSNGSATALSAAIMTGGTWLETVVRNVSTSAYAVASNGAGYLLVTSGGGVNTTRIHAWNGAWQPARDLGLGQAFSVAAASDGSGYGALVTVLSPTTTIRYVAIPEPVAGALGAPLLLSTGTVSSAFGAPLVHAVDGFLAAWAQRYAATPAVDRIVARAGL